MNKLYLIRHAESTANLYKKIYKQSGYIIPESDIIYEDALLSINGIEQIINNRTFFEKLINENKIDYIFCSTMRRAIQTCLLTFNKINLSYLKKTVFCTSLLNEFGDSIENTNKSIDVINSDPNIFCYTNFKQLDFNTYKAYNGKFKKNNINERVNEFCKLINEFFYDKSILVFTHWGFIITLTNKTINNYECIECII
jgi:broad specificity phosphatase PhoE